MPISSDLKKIYASAPTGQRFVEVLRFIHPAFTQPWMLCNDLQDNGLPWTFSDEIGTLYETTYCPFEVSLPKHDSAGGRQDMVIAIGNVDRLIMKELEAAQAFPDTPITCTLLIYTNTLDSAPSADPITLSIADPVATLETITLTASRFDVLNRSFPATSEVYRIDRFPGLDR